MFTFSENMPASADPSLCAHLHIPSIIQKSPRRCIPQKSWREQANQKML